jgi:hypothetical protein
MPSLAELLERGCVVQMESTIPAELTIAQWRRAQARQRVEPRRGRRLRRVRRWGRSSIEAAL